ncbi:1927_t:CDS:10 [Diversispora eburnea]|uniref:1927_t:CDS:1 n=1 Tax=Diversispora eburnea TaxID=1213867 RepID=A0A9N9F403_9GLOM|nr:1927_t:CDS:10 [Diversispora eburnea]
MLFGWITACVQSPSAPDYGWEVYVDGSMGATCSSDGVTSCVQSPSAPDYGWWKCMSYGSGGSILAILITRTEKFVLVKFWESATSSQKRKFTTISERATLMEEHATTVLKLTSQQDQLIREKFTSHLENEDADEQNEEIKNLTEYFGDETRRKEKINYADNLSLDLSDLDYCEDKLNDNISENDPRLSIHSENNFGESTPCPTNILTRNISLNIYNEQENNNEGDKNRYDAESPEECYSSNFVLSLLTNVSPETCLQQLNLMIYHYYPPAHSFILDLSPSSKIKNEFSCEQWSEFLTKCMNLSQARLKWYELRNMVAPTYNELSYAKNDWEKIRRWIERVIGQFLNAFESFRNPLVNDCHEREWTGEYIIPLIKGVLSLDDNCIVPWGEISVLATQFRRNNSKDINTEKVTRSHLADFLCKYERNEIAFGLVCGGPHAYDLTKYASDQFNLPRMMKDMLDDLVLKFYYANNPKLYIIGIQIYMTEVQIYLMEKHEIYFLHHLKSFDLPISFSSYKSLKSALKTVWNIRGLINSLIREFDIIFDNNDGFKTPPPRLSDNMKTKETPSKQPKKKGKAKE